MIYRHITPAIQQDLHFFPVVAIIGPRQVGKTTLARTLADSIEKGAVYLDVESAEDRAKLSAAEAYLRQHEGKCVILDEVQTMPQLMPMLRSLVDKHRVPARFILLGSASPQLLRDSSESLAGRIAYHELTPFGLPEVSPPYPMREHWFRGGFPEAFLAASQAQSYRWMEQFTTTFIERDLQKVLGWEVDSRQMSRLVRMLGHLHGQMLNVADLSRSMDMAVQSVNKYLFLLEGAFLVTRLEPYFRNIGKRLTKTPKFYFRDSGFFHTVQRITEVENLYGSPYIGASWEGYVIEQIRRSAGKVLEYYFYRTHNGAEIDLLIVTPRGELAAVEIKYSNAPVLSRGFHQSCEDLGIALRYVITPDSERVPYPNEVVACSLSHFLAAELPSLLV